MKRVVKGAIPIIAPMTSRQRYQQSTGRDPSDLTEVNGRTGLLVETRVCICWPDAVRSASGRLGETSDPRARLTQEESGAIVMSRDYRTGEKAAGISSLFSCRIGRTPVWGGHAPPDWRDASRTRVRSLRSL